MVLSEVVFDTPRPPSECRKHAISASISPLKADTALLMPRAAREILLAVRADGDATLVTVGLIERAGEVVLTHREQQRSHRGGYGADGGSAREP